MLRKNRPFSVLQHQAQFGLNPALVVVDNVLTILILILRFLVITGITTAMNVHRVLA